MRDYLREIDLNPGTGPIINSLDARGHSDFVLRRECCHQRRSVQVWLDPMGPLPPAGQPIVVQVSAWAKDGACC